MKRLFLISLVFLSSCTTLPQLYQSVDDMATNNSIDVSISKEVIDSGKNLSMSIDLNEMEKK